MTVATSLPIPGSLPALALEATRRGDARRGGGPIVIGLVNNMPDTALHSTERQFRELLSAASGGRGIVLRIFSLPGLHRSDAALQYVRERYQDIGELWNGALDGLIVTGTEPLARDLRDEPCWPALTRLIEWASENTMSAIWSCLAAHAAVQCLDGIRRCALPAKLSGVFEVAKASDHPIVGYGRPRWRIPHSRHNDIPEHLLVAAGYQVLARSGLAGADLFVKRRNSLFVFLQGHPEYDEQALLREYRRDIRRFLAGESEEYPAIPHGYFGNCATRALVTFREAALRDRRPGRLSSFPLEMARRDLLGSWSGVAVRLYANWLDYVFGRKSARLALGTRATAGAAAAPASTCC